jgi:hypothetical protein
LRRSSRRSWPARVGIAGARTGRGRAGPRGIARRSRVAGVVLVIAPGPSGAHGLRCGLLLARQGWASIRRSELPVAVRAPRRPPRHRDRDSTLVGGAGGPSTPSPTSCSWGEPVPVGGPTPCSRLPASQAVCRAHVEEFSRVDELLESVGAALVLSATRRARAQELRDDWRSSYGAKMGDLRDTRRSCRAGRRRETSELVGPYSSGGCRAVTSRERFIGAGGSLQAEIGAHARRGGGGLGEACSGPRMAYGARAPEVPGAAVSRRVDR